MKRVILLSFVAVLICQSAFAKEPKRPDSYNYQRGVELVKSDDLDEAIDFLNKEISQNPKNGYAYSWMALAYSQKKERGTAIYLAENALKYLPKADKYYIAWTNNFLGKLYLQLSDTTKALTYFNASVKAEPKNEEWYEERGLLYSKMKQWDKSDADFREYIKLTPGLIRGNIYLGNNLFEQKKFEEALEQFKTAHQLAERSFTYSGMAAAEVELGMYEEAVSHLIEALKLESYEETAFDLLSKCTAPEFVQLVKLRLKAQSQKNPNVIDWYLYQLPVLENQKEYEEAITICQKMRSISPTPHFDYYLSGFYSKMGDFPNALRYINEAISADSTETSYIYARANIFNDMDSVELMYADINKLIDDDPDNADLYFTRAGFHFDRRNYKQAIEDYDMALALNSSADWFRFYRARSFAAIGETEKAEKDYLRVENSRNVEIRMFAKILLGKNDEARLIADSLLNADTAPFEYHYNVACAYALLGEKQLAMKTLEEELADGNINFNHIRQDIDFQSLHGDEFDQLLQKYEQIARQRILNFNSGQEEQTGEERIVEVPFSAANGVTKVDCTINNLPLNFVFDTGASDVTISQVEANFMFKNGYLSDKDVVGTQRYMTADGNVSVGTTVNLRQINFGGLELQNVRASVVKSQNAPLLLGQSVLQRLGKIEIDNEKRILRITTK